MISRVASNSPPGVFRRTKRSAACSGLRLRDSVIDDLHRDRMYDAVDRHRDHFRLGGQARRETPAQPILKGLASTFNIARLEELGSPPLTLGGLKCRAQFAPGLRRDLPEGRGFQRR